MNPTQERLQELFTYDASTGVLTRRCDAGPQKTGTVPGYIHSSGYRIIRVDGERYKAHRLVWCHVHGHMPMREIDHINHEKADNRICNLRDVSRTSNARNILLGAQNTSGFVGVCRDKARCLWRASVRLGNKDFFLGRYHTKEEAIAARHAANLLCGFTITHTPPPKTKTRPCPTTPVPLCLPIMSRRKDIAGETFGLLRVERYLSIHERHRRYNGAVYLCTCRCGTHCEVPADRLRSGRNVTCGSQACRKALHDA